MGTLNKLSTSYDKFTALNYDVRHTDCTEEINTDLNWRKLFGLSKCILRVSNRGRQKHRRNNDQRTLERINRWNSGDFGGLWNKAFSLRRSKR